MVQTEFEFTLPCGYVDEQGAIHRQGVMRPAMAQDEAEVHQDPRARGNEVWTAILLLSRVVIRLGEVSPVTPGVVGRLFAMDFAFLQDLYVQINNTGSSLIETQCPSCATRFCLDLAR